MSIWQVLESEPMPQMMKRQLIKRVFFSFLNIKLIKNRFNRSQLTVN
jgi:hypothetical protein